MDRILFPTILTNLIYIFLFEVYKQITFLDAVKIFIYPNRSWFCGAILLYAIGYYFLTKSSNKTIFSIALVCIFTYITYYVFVMDLSSWHIESIQYGGLCRIMFYMLCMITGLLYHRLEHYNNGVPCKIDLAVAIISFLAIYIDKYLMQKYEIFMKLQFLNQIFTLVCIVGVFSFLRKIEGKVEIPGRHIVVTIAEYSWEIYITQTLIIPFCQNLTFPINVIVIVLLISISAKIVKDITNTGLKIKNDKLKRKENYDGLQ